MEDREELRQPHGQEVETKYSLLVLSMFFVVLLIVYLKEPLGEIVRRNLLKERNSEKEAPIAITKLQARVLLISCAAMYGSNFVGTKMLQKTLAPSMITTLRFFIGCLFFLGPLMRFRGDGRVLRGAFELGVWTASGFLVQAITLQYTTANKNAFLCALSVVMIPILESLLCCFSSKYCRICPLNHLNSTPKPHNLSGILIPAIFSVSGILALEYGDLEPPSRIDLVVLIAPMCFAIGFWRTEQMASQFPNDTAVITGTLLLTTTFICLMYSLLSGEFPRNAYELKIAFSSIFLDYRVLGGLLYAGFAHASFPYFSRGVCMTAWSSYAEQCSLKVLTAAETTVIYSLEPLFAALFSSIFLHEYFGLNSLIGATCIVLACLWDSVLSPYLSQYVPFLGLSEDQIDILNKEKSLV